MNLIKRALVCAVGFLVGCGTVRDVAMTPVHVTRDVAVGSYRVATAPVRYAFKRRDEPRMVETTEAMPSDVTEPGQPVPPSEVAAAPQRRPQIETKTSESPRRTAPRVARETTQAKPKPSPPPQVSSAQTEFPTAKTVPDKPGYVFSPFDSSGRYVDVSGYAPGTKVKDPWTDKIFIVP
jgi:hypothetical protein